MGLDMFLFKSKIKLEDQKTLNDIQKLRRKANFAFMQGFKDVLFTFSDLSLDEILTKKQDELSTILSKEFFIEYKIYKEKGLDSETNEKMESFLEKLQEDLKIAKELKSTFPDIKIQNVFEFEELGYFRKHPNLHGYIENIYRERITDDDDVFNQTLVVLTKQDITDLVNHCYGIVNGTIEDEEITGYFFGESDEETWRESLTTFTKILNTVDFDKETVLYDSWW